VEGTQAELMVMAVAEIVGQLIAAHEEGRDVNLTMYADAIRLPRFLSGDWSSSFVSSVNEIAINHLGRHHHERTTMVTVITG
jgi:hypothetical protein